MMVGSRAPSIAAASSISTGISARNERIIQTAIGRFIAGVDDHQQPHVVEHVGVLGDQVHRQQPATAGIILVDRKKNITSVHFLTGLIDSAYAAGVASSSTSIVETMLAVAS